MVARQLSELKSSVSILRKQTLRILTKKNNFASFYLSTPKMKIASRYSEN